MTVYYNVPLVRRIGNYKLPEVRMIRLFVQERNLSA